MRVLDSLQTCDSRSGQLLKLYIGKSCSNTCEFRNEKENDVAENSVDELGETGKHKNLKSFTSFDGKTKTETGVGEIFIGEGEESNKDLENPSTVKLSDRATKILCFGLHRTILPLWSKLIQKQMVLQVAEIGFCTKTGHGTPRKSVSVYNQSCNVIIPVLVRPFSTA